MPFPGVWVFLEGESLPVSVLFVKGGRLKGKGVHKGVFAAAASGFRLRSFQQPASDPLPSEPFADEKELDAEPVAEGLSGQPRELSAALVFQKYADGNVLGRLAVRKIIFTDTIGRRFQRI